MNQRHYKVSSHICVPMQILSTRVKIYYHLNQVCEKLNLQIWKKSMSTFCQQHICTNSTIKTSMSHINVNKINIYSSIQINISIIYK